MSFPLRGFASLQMREEKSIGSENSDFTSVDEEEIFQPVLLGRIWAFRPLYFFLFEPIYEMPFVC